MARKVLIVGSRGFVGRHLCAEFEAHGDLVWGVDRTDAAEPVDLGNPQEARRVIARVNPDFIVQAAGRVGEASEAELRAAHLVPTLALLDAVADLRAGARILLVGSAAEFGVESARRVYRECDSGAPTSAYGRSKLEQSLEARRLSESRGLDLIRVRLFNTLGPGQTPALVGGAMVDRLYTLFRGGTDRFVVRDPESQRDFLDIRDIARLMRRLLESLPKNPGRPPVNLCSGEGTSIAALAGELLAAAGVEARVAFERPDRPPTAIVGECSTLAQVLRPGEPVAGIGRISSLRDMWQARVDRGD